MDGLMAVSIGAVADPEKRFIAGRRSSASFSESEVWLLNQLLDAASQHKWERIKELLSVTTFPSLLKKGRALRRSIDGQAANDQSGRKYSEEVRARIWAAYVNRTTNTYAAEVAAELGLRVRYVREIVRRERARRGELQLWSDVRVQPRTPGEIAMVDTYLELRRSNRIYHGALAYLARKHGVGESRAGHLCLGAWKRHLVSVGKEAAE